NRRRVASRRRARADHRPIKSPRIGSRRSRQRLDLSRSPGRKHRLNIDCAACGRDGDRSHPARPRSTSQRSFTGLQGRRHRGRNRHYRGPGPGAQSFTITLRRRGQRQCAADSIKLAYANNSPEQNRLRSLFLIILLCSFSAVSLAQNPKPSPTPKDEQEPVRVFTEEVRLPVAATDTYGHYDPTLDIDDVMILEDGQPQQIRSIQHLPTNVLLLLDLGNQLGLKDTNLTRDVAMRVVSTLYQGNRIAVMQFATKPELLLNWTTDKAAVARVLKTKLNSGKNSRLSDALAAAADQFKDTAPGTRHLVIVTDGVEAPGGKVTMTNALKQLNSVQASVHIISYTLLARVALQGQGKITRGGNGVQRDGNPGSNPVANGDPTLPPGTTRTPSFKIGAIDTDVAMRRKRKE